MTLPTNITDALQAWLAGTASGSAFVLSSSEMTELENLISESAILVEELNVFVGPAGANSTSQITLVSPNNNLMSTHYGYFGDFNGDAGPHIYIKPTDLLNSPTTPPDLFASIDGNPNANGTGDTTVTSIIGEMAHELGNFEDLTGGDGDRPNIVGSTSTPLDNITDTANKLISEGEATYNDIEVSYQIDTYKPSTGAATFIQIQTSANVTASLAELNANQKTAIQSLSGYIGTYGTVVQNGQTLPLIAYYSGSAWWSQNAQVVYMVVDQSNAPVEMYIYAQGATLPKTYPVGVAPSSTNVTICLNNANGTSDIVDDLPTYKLPLNGSNVTITEDTRFFSGANGTGTLTGIDDETDTAIATGGPGVYAGGASSTSPSAITTVNQTPTLPRRPITAGQVEAAALPTRRRCTKSNRTTRGPASRPPIT